MGAELCQPHVSHRPAVIPTRTFVTYEEKRDLSDVAALSAHMLSAGDAKSTAEYLRLLKGRLACSVLYYRDETLLCFAALSTVKGPGCVITARRAVVMSLAGGSACKASQFELQSSEQLHAGPQYKSIPVYSCLSDPLKWQH